MIADVGLATLSIFNAPQRCALMAVLKAYFDDSGDEDDRQHRVCSMGGYVATVGAWAAIEEAWRKVLNKWGIPYLHMVDFAHFVPPFERFENDEKGRVEFLQSLIGVVGASDLEGIASVTRLTDLRKFNCERDLRIEAYPFNLYTNMVQVSQRWPDDTVEIVIDRTSNHGPKAVKAREYANTDAYYPRCGENIEIFPLEKGTLAREIAALQIADFLAWESRKDIDTKDEWFATIKNGDDLNAWIQSLRDWSRERGKAFPYNRKSITSLLAARPVDGVVWPIFYSWGHGEVLKSAEIRHSWVAEAENVVPRL